MNPRRFKRRDYLFVLLAVAAPVFAEVPNMSGPEIIARMVENDKARTAELREYSAVRRYSIENKRFHKIAEATVKMTYSHPGRKEFTVLSETGPHFIHDRVVSRMVESELEASREPLRQTTLFTPANYDFRYLGVDADRGRRAYLFEITPKVVSKYMIKGRIWLDAEDFAITRVEGKPARNPSFWIRSSSFVYTFEKHGGFWLATSNVGDSDSVLFGQTSVEISYSDYTINPDPATRRAAQQADQPPSPAAPERSTPATPLLPASRP